MSKKSLSKNISNCRICYSKDIVDILDLGNQPTANQLIKNIKQKEKKFPLKLVLCKKCKTLQLSTTVSSKYLFSKYLWVTETSDVAKKYSEIFYKRIKKKFGKSKPNYVLEIASNDGTFLKTFKNNKINVLGVDPAKNISKIANKKGIKTISKFFDEKLATKIKYKYGKPEIIIARNVIPHVEEIHDVVKGISKIASKKSIVVIEFHYLKEIISGLQYDSIYHEHIFYYSIKSISNLFRKYNLFPHDIERSPISGGSLVLYFSKNKMNKTKSLNNLINIEKKSQINSVKKLLNFSRKCINHRNQLSNFINNKITQEIYGYGASARSSTLLNFSKINYSKIKFIIDKNKLKQNLYTPGSKIKIVNFNKKLIKKNSYIIVLAWNFYKEILKFLRKNKISCKIILPLPNKIKIL